MGLNVLKLLSFGVNVKDGQITSLEDQGIYETDNMNQV